MNQQDFYISKQYLQTLNERVRTLQLKPADLASIASRHRVTLRTAQRWFTQATERRNLIPLSAADKYYSELPAATASRVFTAITITEGWTAPPPPDVGSFKDTTIYTATLRGAIDIAEAIQAGIGDPFLVANATFMLATYVPSEDDPSVLVPALQITYATQYIPEAYEWAEEEKLWSPASLSNTSETS